MKAADVVKVWLWLIRQRPNADTSHLQEEAEKAFGKIEWDSQQGYGEGLIICKFPAQGVKGYSGGLCTAEEALMDAMVKLLSQNPTVPE